MKLMYKVFYALLIAGFFLVSCDGEFDTLVDANADRNPIPDMEIEVSQGDADLTNFVAIGNSLTAGYMDGALYNNGQRFSLGALLSAQFEHAGAPSVFNQPDINSVNGCNTSIQGNCQSVNPLGRFKLDTNIPGPSPTVGGDRISGYDGAASSLNNFGVPGIRVVGLTEPQVGNPNSDLFNPFYARFASSPGVSTIIDDVVSSNPTFFTLWAGNQDVLAFALSGARNASALTSTEDFQSEFENVISTLMTETGASGVVGNIPQILGVPFFRAVPYNAIPLDQNSADQLNEGFQGLNMVLDAIVANLGHNSDDADRRRPNYQAGPNPILIVDRNLENLGPKFDILVQFGGITPEEREALQPYVQSRPIEQGELVLLSAAPILGTPADPNNPNTPIGVVIPLGAELTLTFEEQIQIETARQTFNEIIKGAVTSANEAGNRLALYDSNRPDGAFAQIFGLDGSAPGITVDGVNLRPDFGPNGVFSTDGVHPNPRGTAILANEFIRVVETEFNAVIPRVSVLALPSVALCAGDCVGQQAGS